MKKTFIMAALVLTSIGCVAQQTNVKKAKSIALNTEAADYEQARQLIGEAIKNDETKNLAETYFVAGLIGYQQNNALNMQAVLNGGLDQEKAGMAISESYDYWLKADELAMIPTIDKKGREVLDLKTRNAINKKMLEYWKGQNFISYGIWLNDQKDYFNAYQAFMKHLNMPDLPMMQEPKLQTQLPKDTTYYQYMYYAGLFAVQAELHNEAIDIFEKMKNGEVEAIACNQFLYQEYVTLKDTANFVRVLSDAVTRFPQEPWFLQNLINYYLFSDQQEQAINYLNEAIEREPNVAQYHYIKGNLDENRGHYEEALTDFDRALAIDPTMADAVAGKGRVYYNQAVKLNEAATLINDPKEYKEALNQMNTIFRLSLPFFEEVRNMTPDDRDNLIVLKGLYYRFGMEDMYNQISDELNK